MKQVLTFIKCDGEGRSYRKGKCTLTNHADIEEVLKDEEYKYKIKFAEYNGKDYCESCYIDVTLAEYGFKKCPYCNDGKKSKVKGMPENWSPGYYDKITKDDIEIYTCGHCDGTGTIKL